MHAYITYRLDSLHSTTVWVSNFVLVCFEVFVFKLIYPIHIFKPPFSFFVNRYNVPFIQVTIQLRHREYKIDYRSVRCVHRYTSHFSQDGNIFPVLEYQPCNNNNIHQWCSTLSVRQINNCIITFSINAMPAVRMAPTATSIIRMCV